MAICAPAIDAPETKPSVKLPPVITSIVPVVRPAVLIFPKASAIATALGPVIPAASNALRVPPDISASNPWTLVEVITCCVTYAFTPASKASPQEPPSDLTLIPCM